MKIEYLIKMANEIDAFFASEAAPGERAAQVAGHMRRFWDPRMRAQLQAHCDAGGAGLHEHVRQAVAILEAARAAASPASPGGAR